MEFNETSLTTSFNEPCINGTSLYFDNSTLSHTPCEAFKDPSYYALPYRIIGTIFQGFVLVVGVLGNIMVIIVVTKSRGMKTPTNCYLVSLSMADLMVLLSAVPNEILSYYVLGEQWVWGQVGCALFIFAQYLGINASSLSITAFTIERYIAICHPMKAQKVCTVHRAKNIIGIVWGFAVIYCSPWLFLTETKPVYYKGLTDIETCTFSMPRQYYWGYFFADLVLFYIFPLLLSCILYSMIARILFTDNLSKSMQKSKKKEHKKKMKKIVDERKRKKKLISKKKESDIELGGEEKNEKANDEDDGFGTNPTNVENNSSTAPHGSSYENHRSTNQSADNARVQVVKMLVVVVAVFATLWLPYRALLVYNSFASHRYMELWFLMFCKTMIFVNSAINPILYNALSVKFRRAFKDMLCCDPRSSTRSGYRGGAAGTFHSGHQTTPLAHHPNTNAGQRIKNQQGTSNPTSSSILITHGGQTATMDRVKDVMQEEHQV